MNEQIILQCIDKEQLINKFFKTSGEQNKELKEFLSNLEYIDCNNIVFEILMNNVNCGLVSIEIQNQAGIINILLNDGFRGLNIEQFILNECEKILFDEYNEVSRINSMCSINDIAMQYKLKCLGYKLKGNNNITSQVIFEKEINCNINRTMFNRIKEKSILFLSNNENSILLYEWLLKEEKNVYFYSLQLNRDQINNMNLDYIISYNYVPIIKSDVIDIMQGKILNLHTSFLPWNKGLRPNFWSFILNTKKGVTIHYIDKGIDTGDIIVQKELFFDESKETFVSSYNALNNEIVKLFQDNWSRIKKGTIHSYKMTNKGSYHSKKDFECFNKKYPVSWDDIIKDYKCRIEGDNI